MKAGNICACYRDQKDVDFVDFKLRMALIRRGCAASRRAIRGIVCKIHSLVT